MNWWSSRVLPPLTTPSFPSLLPDDDDDDTTTEPDHTMFTNTILSQVILDSLVQHNPALVTEVRNLVAELCRVTLLWDEMWLAALMQRQGEVHRWVGMVTHSLINIHSPTQEVTSD